jgi:hypothetical protein
MSIKIIAGYNDPEWDAYSDMFYAHFNPDDWDYIIEGTDRYGVENIAERLRLYGCDYVIKQIGDKWVAVTYHA